MFLCTYVKDDERHLMPKSKPIVSTHLSEYLQILRNLHRYMSCTRNPWTISNNFTLLNSNGLIVLRLK